jgi:hypothetical protein
MLQLISCGRGGGGASSSSVAQEEFCDLNGRGVDCASIEGADGEGIDLLEAVIDVPVTVTGSGVTFLSDRQSTNSGRRINCNISVRAGESYRYVVKEEKLILQTPEGLLEMNRISEGEGLAGAWMWKGYVDEGMHLIRKFTVVENRAIIRKHCEL